MVEKEYPKLHRFLVHPAIKEYFSRYGVDPDKLYEDVAIFLSKHSQEEVKLPWLVRGQKLKYIYPSEIETYIPAKRSGINRYDGGPYSFIVYTSTQMLIL